MTPGLTSGQLIRAEVDGRLTYSLPLFNACMLNCAAADPDGDVYCRGQSMISDAMEQALAVKRNGGTVYVTVGLLVPKGCAAVRRPPPLPRYPDFGFSQLQASARTRMRSDERARSNKHALVTSFFQLGVE